MLLIGLLLLLSLALGLMLYPLRQSRKWWLLWIPMVIVFLVVGYWRWGGWRELRQYQQQQIKQQYAQKLLQSMHGPEGIIKALLEKLQKTPNSAEGWFLLGRLYTSQQQWEKACKAFEQSHRLQPDNDKTTVHYAQSLWECNHQRFDSHIRDLLEAVLQHDPNQPDALAMLAADAFQRKANQQAKQYWQRLLKQLPPQSDEARAFRRAIRSLRDVKALTGIPVVCSNKEPLTSRGNSGRAKNIQDIE